MRLLTAIGFCLLFSTAHAVTVTDAWARASVPGQSVGGVFMTLTSNSKATLLEARCECAQAVQIHETVEKNGVASMREKKKLELPAGQVIQLKPGGLHIMLFGLKAPLKAGQHLPLTLVLEENGKRLQQQVDVQVRAPGAMSDHHHHHAHD